MKSRSLLGRVEGARCPAPQRRSAVTKADIVDRIAEGTGLTKLETEAVVDGFVITVMEALEGGGSVELRGFGSFRVRERAARMARNPQTDEPIEVPRQFVPAFKPSRQFRDVVNEARLAAEREGQPEASEKP